ncbi:MFS general substrate transporter [Apiospora hydei]|uniref:MFS general substrate transporter n=1 Tax=Apiospora hydei TaxID=1337664 RepID=A0ABR1V713_9PEZI
MSTQTVVATEPQSIPMAELELRRPERCHGRDLGDPEAGNSPGMFTASAADTSPAVVQHLTVVDQTPAVPYFKLLVAGFSYICAGINDGTLGPLIPHIINTFRIGTGEVAIIYVSTFAGWLLAAATGPLLTPHLTLGQLLAAGAALQLLAQCLRPWDWDWSRGGSPFPQFCATFFVQALGMAYQDSHANTFVSGLPHVPHRWLGFIHACYALGCLVGPLIATGLVATTSGSSTTTGTGTGTTGVDGGWRRVYFILIGIGVLNMAGVALAFKDSLWSKAAHPSNATTTTTTNSRRTKAAFQELVALLRSKALWLLSLFYFFNFGALLTAGGWVVEFLTAVRGAPSPPRATSPRASGPACSSAGSCSPSPPSASASAACSSPTAPPPPPCSSSSGCSPTSSRARSRSVSWASSPGPSSLR